MERLSLTRIYSEANASVARNYQRLFQVQQQIGTGKRLIRPSDDPAQTGRLFGLRSEGFKIDRYLRAIDSSEGQINMGASQLQEITSQIQRVRELAVQGANGTLNAQDRNSIGLEVDELLHSLLASANVKLNDRYLFAGTDSGAAPYALATGADGLERVNYLGNDQILQVDVAPGIRMPMNIPGTRIFRAGARTETTFGGNTGAASGSGADSGTGRATLLVQHSQTLYSLLPDGNGGDPTTGVRPSASSGQDTVLGLGHKLTVTTDASGAGTVSLNGGPAVSFTTADTDLEVLDANGNSVHLDMSGVQSNLGGLTVDIDARGTLSLDGGATTTAIDFSSSSMQITNPVTGQVLHVDATGITSAGSEAITFPGTFDLFDSVIAIRDALTDGTLDGGTVNGLLNDRIAELDRNLDDITTAMAELGARSNRLESSRNRLLDLELTVVEQQSEIEDADLSEATLNLSRYESLYQASLVMASRISQISYLNYI